MFIDNAKIFVKAGNGGNGVVSFRREKYVAAGGPDGGDGGKGGDIKFVVDEGIRTLQDFRYRRKYKADSGNDGSGAKRSGRSGSDMIIKVPMGTIVRDEESGQIIADLVKADQTVIIAKGGRGGKGNQHFATPTRQIPLFARNGEPGEERWITMELKLLADVGLIGFPNVGKSTMLSSVSAATPKIADYHFTTLEPNLGVVSLDEGNSFVIADIPGLIEGAHMGIGLGHDFLKHIERTRLLIHVVDMPGTEGRDPLNDFRIINKELEEYSKTLSQKPQIVAANKMDVTNGEENFEIFKNAVEGEGYKVFPVSSATGKGLKELMYYAGSMLSQLPATPLMDISDAEEIVYTVEEEEPFEIRKEGEIYVVEGNWVKRILGSVNLDNHDSLQYFQRAIKNKGVVDELEKMGINEGDTVKFYDLEFEYIK